MLFASFVEFDCVYCLWSASSRGYRYHRANSHFRVCTMVNGTQQQCRSSIPRSPSMEQHANDKNANRKFARKMSICSTETHDHDQRVPRPAIIIIKSKWSQLLSYFINQFLWIRGPCRTLSLCAVAATTYSPPKRKSEWFKRKRIVTIHCKWPLPPRNTQNKLSRLDTKRSLCSLSALLLVSSANA